MASTEGSSRRTRAAATQGWLATRAATASVSIESSRSPASTSASARTSSRGTRCGGADLDLPEREAGRRDHVAHRLLPAPGRARQDRDRRQRLEQEQPAPDARVHDARDPDRDRGGGDGDTVILPAPKQAAPGRRARTRGGRGHHGGSDARLESAARAARRERAGRAAGRPAIRAAIRADGVHVLAPRSSSSASSSPATLVMSPAPSTSTMSPGRTSARSSVASAGRRT